MSITIGSGYEVSAPTAPSTVVSSTTGSLGNGNYIYKVTYVNVYGETASSPVSNTLNPNPSTAITVTLPISTDVSVTARKLYRTAAGGSVYGLVTTISNNTQTSYTDTLADGSLGAAPPVTSTAMSSQILYGNVKLNQPMQTAGVTTITAGTTQTQAGATAIGLNQFASVTTGNANDGVVLPLLNSNMVGVAIFINNLSANALKVYPGTGQTINGGGVNVSVTHAASVSRWYVASSATNWVQV